MATLSEDDIIARYFAPLAGAGGLGLKDDAALISPPRGHELVVSKDMLAAGGHFFANDPPDTIAKKALRVNVSDLVAKGAQPLGFLLGLALPDGITESWIAAFAKGLGEDAKLYNMPLLGGDTVKGPLTISITAFGSVPKGKMIPRTGVKAGDELFVCGPVGESALGLRILLNSETDRHWISKLKQEHKDYLVKTYRVPNVIDRHVKILREHAHAAMDISDGLVGDLTKMLKVSGVSAEVRTDLSLFYEEVLEAMRVEPSLGDVALTGGDDYVVLCAVPPEKANIFWRLMKRQAVSALKIGVAVEGTHPPIFFDFDGNPKTFKHSSFSHF